MVLCILWSSESRDRDWYAACNSSLEINTSGEEVIMFGKLTTCVAVAAWIGIATASAADKVVLQLAWTAEPEFGGFFQAKQAGIYEKYGLDVDIKMGSPQTNAAQLLLAGKTDFINGPSNDALNATQAGFPVTVVAGIFQKDPRVLISHTGAGNDTLEAMKGKPIMVAATDQVTFWPFLRAKYGFADTQIRPYTFNSAPFMVDKTAIQQGYVTSEPFALRKLGADLNVILLSDHGYQTYAATITTTRKMIAENPGLVQRFVDASIEGWYSYLYGDASPANDFIKRSNPDMQDDQIAYSMQALKETGMVDSGDAKVNGIGAMSDARWTAMFEAMVAAGLCPPDMNYHAAYTLQFVNKKVGIK
jgi:NitT/TauT family transport system substrate-binding protein